MTSTSGFWVGAWTWYFFGVVMSNTELPQFRWVSQDADMLFSEIRQLVWEKWESQSV